jgi:ribulose 1,5-bisphosphate synthetase/thiazole synthase
MEGRSHDKKSYAVAGQVSNMANDLELCSRDFRQSYMARPAIRTRAADMGGQPCAAIRVCVVGAGLAGLRCAEILAQAGVDVTLYEARDRVGGRVSPIAL